MLKKHFIVCLRHRFTLESVVVTDFPPDGCTGDNRVCTALPLKRLPVFVMWCPYSLYHLQLSNTHYTHTEMRFDTAPWLFTAGQQWWAVNRASVRTLGRSAGVKVPFLHQPYCSLSELQHLSISLLKVTLSSSAECLPLCRWTKTLFFLLMDSSFFSSECGGAGMCWSGCFFF